MNQIELVYTDLDRIEYGTLRALSSNYPLDTSDTTLIMDDGAELSAHEFVLSAFSSVFKLTYRHLHPDLSDGKYRIRLRHIPTCIMENILSMMYKGGMRFPARDFRKLRKAARHLNLNGFTVPNASEETAPSSDLATSFRTFHIRQRSVFEREAFDNEDTIRPRMRRPTFDARPRSEAIEE